MSYHDYVEFSRAWKSLMVFFGIYFLLQGSSSGIWGTVIVWLIGEVVLLLCGGSIPTKKEYESYLKHQRRLMHEETADDIYEREQEQWVRGKIADKKFEYEQKLREAYKPYEKQGISKEEFLKINGKYTMYPFEYGESFRDELMKEYERTHPREQKHEIF